MSDVEVVTEDEMYDDDDGQYEDEDDQHMHKFPTSNAWKQNKVFN